MTYINRNNTKIRGPYREIKDENSFHSIVWKPLAKLVSENEEYRSRKTANLENDKWKTNEKDDEESQMLNAKSNDKDDKSANDQLIKQKPWELRLRAPPHTQAIQCYHCCVRYDVITLYTIDYKWQRHSEWLSIVYNNNNNSNITNNNLDHHCNISLILL